MVTRRYILIALVILCLWLLASTGSYRYLYASLFSPTYHSYTKKASEVFSIHFFNHFWSPPSTWSATDSPPLRKQMSLSNWPELGSHESVGVWTAVNLEGLAAAEKIVTVVGRGMTIWNGNVNDARREEEFKSGCKLLPPQVCDHICLSLWGCGVSEEVLPQIYNAVSLFVSMPLQHCVVCTMAVQLMYKNRHTHTPCTFIHSKSSHAWGCTVFSPLLTLTLAPYLPFLRSYAHTHTHNKAHIHSAQGTNHHRLFSGPVCEWDFYGRGGGRHLCVVGMQLLQHPVLIFFPPQAQIFLSFSLCVSFLMLWLFWLFLILQHHSFPLLELSLTLFIFFWMVQLDVTAALKYPPSFTITFTIIHSCLPLPNIFNYPVHFPIYCTTCFFHNIFSICHSIFFLPFFLLTIPSASRGRCWCG